MRLIAFILTLLCSMAWLSSCERDFECYCDIDVQPCIGSSYEYKETVIVKAKSKHDAFEKCHDLDDNDFDNCQTTDYMYKNVFCNSF